MLQLVIFNPTWPIQPVKIYILTVQVSQQEEIDYLEENMTSDYSLTGYLGAFWSIYSTLTEDRGAFRSISANFNLRGCSSRQRPTAYCTGCVSDIELKMMCLHMRKLVVLIEIRTHQPDHTLYPCDLHPSRVKAKLQCHVCNSRSSFLFLHWSI